MFCECTVKSPLGLKSASFDKDVMEGQCVFVAVSSMEISTVCEGGYIGLTCRGTPEYDDFCSL